MSVPLLDLRGLFYAELYLSPLPVISSTAQGLHPKYRKIKIF